MTGAVSRRTPIARATLAGALLLVAGMPAAHAQSTCGDGKMASNTYLTVGQEIKSNDCRFRLRYNSDGNLVLYWTNVQSLWSSKTSGTSTNKVRMQGDGNLVVYNAAGAAVWASGTSGNSGAYLRVQNDGNMVIRRSDGVAIWATNTGGHASNTPPQVSLTSPVNGATLAAGSNITLAATASDSGGSVTKVEFFANGALRGTDTTSPYAIAWSNIAAGSYSLTARATDNEGATKTSTAVNIEVKSGASTGRYKWGPNGCYWEANDSGANQCTPPSPTSYCGDGVCNSSGTEACNTCSQDCGTCPPPDDVVVPADPVIDWSTLTPIPNVINCPGNCGAGCTDHVNPCGGPRQYWELTILSTPTVEIRTGRFCYGYWLYQRTYEAYVASGRWTYHGFYAPGCAMHDATCNEWLIGCAWWAGCGSPTSVKTWSYDDTVATFKRFLYDELIGYEENICRTLGQAQPQN